MPPDQIKSSSVHVQCNDVHYRARRTFKQAKVREGVNIYAMIERQWWCEPTRSSSPCSLSMTRCRPAHPTATKPGMECCSGQNSVNNSEQQYYFSISSDWNNSSAHFLQDLTWSETHFRHLTTTDETEDKDLGTLQPALHENVLNKMIRNESGMSRFGVIFLMYDWVYRASLYRATRGHFGVEENLLGLQPK
jgi:hypothetical protein